jgi:hypothetical protein
MRFIIYIIALIVTSTLGSSARGTEDLDEGAKLSQIDTATGAAPEEPQHLKKGRPPIPHDPEEVRKLSLDKVKSCEQLLNRIWDQIKDHAILVRIAAPSSVIPRELIESESALTESIHLLSQNGPQSDQVSIVASMLQVTGTMLPYKRVAEIISSSADVPGPIAAWYAEQSASMDDAFKGFSDIVSRSIRGDKIEELRRHLSDSLSGQIEALASSLIRSYSEERLQRFAESVAGKIHILAPGEGPGYIMFGPARN